LLFLEGALQQLNYEPPVRLPLPTDRERALDLAEQRR
jgi:hypothetical protein